MAVKKYRCNWAVGHDGKDYAEGDTIEVDKDVATTLLEAGAISAQGKRQDLPKDPPKADGATEDRQGGQTTVVNRSAPSAVPSKDDGADEDPLDAASDSLPL